MSLNRPGTARLDVGLLRVKPLFDRLVGEHLHQAKEVAEKRAARTGVHAHQLPEESLDE
ncbi:MAG: hypothetical protein ACR2MC_03780 [Actinomycetota bacterium]